MTQSKTNVPNPKGDRPGKDSPNGPVRDGRPGPNDSTKVSDPHPDTEEGYDRDHKIPMTGL